MLGLGVPTSGPAFTLMKLIVLRLIPIPFNLIIAAILYKTKNIIFLTAILII